MQNLICISRIDVCVAFRYRHLIEYIQRDFRCKLIIFNETFNKKLNLVFTLKTEKKDFINHNQNLLS